MPIPLTNNIRINAQKSTDDRYGKELNGATIPFSSVAEVISSIPSQRRYRGLVSMVDDGSGLRNYWFRDDILDSSLILKDAEISFDSAVFKGKYTSSHDSAWLALNPVGSPNNPLTLV